MQLLQNLQNLWPYYIALFTSFFTLLIMWVNHHNMLRKVNKVSRQFLFVNGILLFLVIIVPYPTAMVSQFLLTPSANTACAVYAGFFVLINISYNLVWYTAIRRKLLAETITNQVIRKVAISNWNGRKPGKECISQTNPFTMKAGEFFYHRLTTSKCLRKTKNDFFLI